MNDPLYSLIDADEIMQPYLLAVKDVSDALTLRSLVHKILGDANVFSGYNDIHSLVKDRLVGMPDGEKLLNTLELFSYGSLSDFMDSPERFVSLNDSQIFKLKQLTLLSLAEEACSNKQSCLAYDYIRSRLNLENMNQVEQILISCLYSRALNGKLNQKTQTLQLDGTHGPCLRSRDVPVNRISDMLETIRAMKSNISACQDVLHKEQSLNREQLHAQTSSYKLVLERMKQAQSQNRDFATAPLLQAQRRGSGWGAMGESAIAAVMAGGADDPMDLGPASGRRQKRSRGGLSGVGDLGAAIRR